MADAFDADLIMKWLREPAELKAVLVFGRAARSAARKSARGAAPGRRSWAARRSTCRRARTTSCTSPRARSAAEPAPFEAHLAWGAQRLRVRRSPTPRSAITRCTRRMAFAGKLGAPKRVGEMLGELAHELIMNALYDAPVDERGKPRFAHDRKAEIRSPPATRPVLRCGSDGVRIAVEVVDRFGRLERKHVFGGLVRGAQGRADGHRRRRRRPRHAGQLPLDHGAVLRRRAAACARA